MVDENFPSEHKKIMSNLTIKCKDHGYFVAVDVNSKIKVVGQVYCSANETWEAYHSYQCVSMRVHYLKIRYSINQCNGIIKIS